MESEHEAGLMACVGLLDPQLNCDEPRCMFIAFEVLHRVTHRPGRQMRRPHLAISFSNGAQSPIQSMASPNACRLHEKEFSDPFSNIPFCAQASKGSPIQEH